MDKVKGSKEELAIIHEAAKKQSWKSFPSIRLSRQASEQLQQIIHQSTAHSKDDEGPGSSDMVAASNTESIALDMVDGDGDKIMDAHIEEGVDDPEGSQSKPDLVVSVEKSSLSQDGGSQTNPKCTCNHGKNIDIEGALPWCDVCIANASPTKESKDLMSDLDLGLDKRWPTTWSHQFVILLMRAFKQSRSLFLKQIDLIRHTLLALIIGVLYFQLMHTEERIHDIRGLVSVRVANDSLI